MRTLFRNRRGSVAFATVIALVPAIGFLALGAEAGSWYVTKQQAQNAADAAAVAGALRSACQLGSVTCTDVQTVDYRGKQFAAQNAFCGEGDATAYPGSSCITPGAGITRTVAIAQPTASRVQATITQTQPAYLAKLLGLSTVTMAVTAIAEVQNPQNICALGLGRYPKNNSSALTLGGNVQNTGNGCALMSNDTVKYTSAPTFTGSNWSVNAAKGCLPNSTQCGGINVPYNYFAPTATNPLSALDSASFNNRVGNDSPLKNATCPVGLPTGTNWKCSSATPNGLGSGAYKGFNVTGNEYVSFASGTYFFYDATIKITGGMVTGTGVTFVLLGNSTIEISGGSVSLSAPATNAVSSLLNGVLIDDQAPNKNNDVKINGGASIKLGGVMYFPNVDVTYSGTSQSTNTTCAAVIANSLDMGGGAYMNTDNCIDGAVSKTQVVKLVQ